ncbi:MAG: tetratricopeptide repeat protein [Nodosilinea sp.]
MHIYPSQCPPVYALPDRPKKLHLTSAPVAFLNTDETLDQQAAAAVKQQQYPHALGLLNQLIERYPQQAVYYSNRGLVHLRLGQPCLALIDCDRSVALDPGLDQVYNNRAMCHAALGNLSAALDDYDQAIDLNPFNNRARINLGTALRRMGDFDLALIHFDEALMFHQLPEFVYAERGRTYHRRGDWNCAIADYRRALAAAQMSADLQPLVERVRRWAAELLPQDQVEML